MVYARRLLGLFALFALCSPLVVRAHAAPLASGAFAADDSFFSYSFTTSASANFTFQTTSFASGGFLPVLTLFNSISGKALAFAETDNSDVTLSQLLNPGSYILYLTEDPNVFTGNLSDGMLFAGSPNVTGDICGVSGGKFLNTFTTPCTQRTGNFAVSLTTTAVTPEPSTWLLLLPPVAFLAVSQRRKRLA